MKCHLCGTDNEYIRVLFVHLECTNAKCANYSPIAAKEKASGVPGDKGTGDVSDSEGEELDWGDVFLDFPGTFP